ncbi:MAG: SDR family oxidoreductase [Gemmatimonadales bacterium]
MAERILVVGASGALGRIIATKLAERGGLVRGMSRKPASLDDLRHRGVEVVAGDLTAPDSLGTACRDVGQIVSTANSFMGSGATSPTRIDVPGYRNLVAAARSHGVRRLVHVSAYGIGLDSTVDYFRVKAAVDEVIRQSAMPFVLLKPSAFLDVWAGMILAEHRAGRPARIFGDGRRVANYIAAEDVAEFAVRIVERPEIAGESVDLGGPSTLSQLELVALMERAIGQPIRRQLNPRLVLRVGSIVAKPFNELVARFMALGAWSAAADRRLDHWTVAAERFGVRPMTAERFLERFAPAAT